MRDSWKVGVALAGCGSVFFVAEFVDVCESLIIITNLWPYETKIIYEVLYKREKLDYI